MCASLQLLIAIEHYRVVLFQLPTLADVKKGREMKVVRILDCKLMTHGAVTDGDSLIPNRLLLCESQGSHVRVLRLPDGAEEGTLDLFDVPSFVATRGDKVAVAASGLLDKSYSGWGVYLYRASGTGWERQSVVLKYFPLDGDLVFTPDGADLVFSPGRFPARVVDASTGLLRDSFGPCLPYQGHVTPHESAWAVSSETQHKVWLYGGASASAPVQSTELRAPGILVSVPGVGLLVQGCPMLDMLVNPWDVLTSTMSPVRVEWMGAVARASFRPASSGLKALCV